eukprot:scaffold300707_cov32-Tisochrysis_lutea.AAC.1
MEAERAVAAGPTTLRSEARYLTFFFCVGRRRRLMLSSDGMVMPSTPSALRSECSFASVS